MGRILFKSGPNCISKVVRVYWYSRTIFVGKVSSHYDAKVVRMYYGELRFLHKSTYTYLHLFHIVDIDGFSIH